MFGIDELVAVVPPPSTPNVRMTQADWMQIFTHMGTRLPGDFAAAYERYGEGHFFSHSHKSSAYLSLCAGTMSMQYLNFVPRRLSDLRVQKEKRPKSVPLPLYWEPGGLLPWATAGNQIDLCWQVRGELVDNWHVVVLRAAQGEHQVFEMSAMQFLARVITGKISCPLLPKGFPGEKGVGFRSIH